MTQGRTPAGRIRSQFREISALDPESFVRTKDLGTKLDFSMDREVYEDIISFTSQASDFPWEMLPKTTQASVLKRLDRLSDSYREVTEFSPTTMQGRDLEHERDYAAEVLRNNIEELKQEVVPLIGYFTWRTGHAEVQRKEFETALRKSQAESRALIAALQESRDESEKIVDAMRSASREVGAGEKAETFGAAAKRYEQASRRWLITFLFAAVLTVVAAALLFLAWVRDGLLTDADILQFVLAKVVILGVLTYVTVFSVRLYRSNAHLAAVNRHRQDALVTFQAFVEGTADQETKDQVLLAAARAAFGQTPTGLVSDKGDGGNMLEVLAGIANNMGRRS